MPSPTVLIVEDELLVREATMADFEDLGFSVLVAMNASEALEVLSDSAVIDLMVTDIRMPGGVDGWELARRARERRPALKVIYATGYAPEDQGLVDGGVVLSKPFRFSDVRAALDKVGLGQA